jgi:hypothetical protein
MAKLAESNKKFDMVLRNVRRWYGLLGQDVIANFQQFGNQDRHWLIRGEEEGEWVEQFLSLPSETVRRGAAIDLTVTDSITNRDVEQQKWQGLFAILTRHYNEVGDQSMTVAQMSGDPTIFLAIANKALQASNVATKRLLETFNVPDIETFLIDMSGEMANAQPEPTIPGAPALGGGGAGALDPTGMAQLLATAGASGPGSQPVNAGLAG